MSIMKKCARTGCGKTCNVPSWKYCSDDCSRLVNNQKALAKKKSTLAKNNNKIV